MLRYEKIKYFLIIWRHNVKPLPGKIKRRIWNKHILFWWYRCWVREDEFHKSLDMDPEAMRAMNKRERKKYFANLLNRRRIAARQGDAVNI